MSSHITPTKQFFLRSHLNYPLPIAPDWTLTVSGLVEEELTLRLDDLSRFPSTKRTVTFECAGNPPGGGMVSTAEWRGISLRHLLEKSRVLPNAKEVVLEGADFGLDEVESIPLIYSRSIPLEKALAAETMIAWEMNGEPLPWEHGFPARIIVPGYYAMSHVKWLTRIRLIDQRYKGFYMIKRYFTARRIPGTGQFEIHPEMKMKVKSQFSKPVPGEQISSVSYVVSGAAWTGDSKIRKVEVSTDGASTWSAAQLLDTPAPYSWVRWQFTWTISGAGRYTLVCRAFDDAGQQQPEAPDDTVINKYGNNWYHRVEVTVRVP